MYGKASQWPCCLTSSGISCSPDGGPGCVSSRFATYLDGVFAFDEALFGLTPVEALAMDPQQRLLLEETLVALCSADTLPQVPPRL